MSLALTLLLDLGLALPPPSGGCAIHSHDPLVLWIEPAGAGSFQLRTEGLATVARPPARRGGAIAVEVPGPIALRGTLSDASFRLRTPLTLLGGMVQLETGAVIDHLRAAAAGAIGTVSSDGSVSEPRVTGVPLPCESLTLDEVAHSPSPPHGDAGPPRDDAGEPRVLRDRAIELRPRPGAGPAVVLREGGDGPLAVAAGERSGRFQRIAWHDTRVRLSGWVRRDQLAAPPPGMYGVDSHSIGCLAGCPTPAPAAVPPRPATLLAGTTLFAAPHAGPWGQVTRDVPVTVTIIPGHPWSAVSTLPHLAESPCSPLTHAFVPTSSLRLP